MNQTWENGEKPDFESQIFFSWVLSLLDVRNCYKLSLYVVLRKTYGTNSRNWWKTSFWALFRPIGPKFGPPFWAVKNLAPSVTRYHNQLSSSTISEKTNDPVLRKFCDGRKDGQKDRQTDERDFNGRCPTNVERLKQNLYEKAFSSVETKTISQFAVKFVGKSSLLFSVCLMNQLENVMKL